MNYCTNCQSLFRIPPDEPIPGWILGVVTILMAHLQILH
jgi:hypothetical protein